MLFGAKIPVSVFGAATSVGAIELLLATSLIQLCSPHTALIVLYTLHPSSYYTPTLLPSLPHHARISVIAPPLARHHTRILSLSVPCRRLVRRVGQEKGPCGDGDRATASVTTHLSSLSSFISASTSSASSLHHPCPRRCPIVVRCSRTAIFTSQSILSRTHYAAFISFRYHCLPS